MPKLSVNTARSFAPIARVDARVLILGSMPGQASLDAGQYYAYPRNAFWPIMGSLLGFDPTLAYAQRTNALSQHHVALWDVLQSCERPGSLDASIVESTIVPNDFAHFFARHGGIRHVFFNGARAETAYRRYVLPGLEAEHRTLASTRLPSTSPAHAALGFDAKLKLWRCVLESLDVKPNAAG